ncbi:MAG: LacI family DNA-binding transcriptional regulator [Roseiarcus sp.]
MREDEEAREAAGARVGRKRIRGQRKAVSRRPTMIDVANEARVSQTAVSLVLNHADGARLSAETRDRVLKAATRLGYQPVRRGGAPGSAARASPPHLRRDVNRSLDGDRP